MLTGTQQVIGKRYVLTETIGEGGMGVVYRAQDRLTGEVVALKQVHVPTEKLELMSSAGSVDFRLALAQEFKTLASLRHPNIISVLDYGFDEQRQPYLTMELLQDKRTIIEAGRDQPMDVQLDLLIQIFQALAYLHRRHILHRDLKPDNVLVVGQHVRLLDFGLAVARSEFDRDTVLEQVSGTLAYMAPELLQGYPPSEASDLYAAGLMAYELFAGQHPFLVDGVGNLVQNIMYTPPDMSLLDADERIVAVLARLLMKDPAERFHDAGEIIALYNRAIGQVVIAETTATRESFLQAAQFVGRDREYNTLKSALNAALKGQGSTWLVGGESGVGKSRLLEEVRTLALVTGASSLRGQAVSDGGSPYQLWGEIARWVVLQTDLSELEASVLKILVPDISALVGWDVPDPQALDPQTAQGRLLTVVEAVFKRLNQPLVIILEDIHWAGSESISLLRRLNNLAAGLPLLVVASYRDDEYPNLPQSLPDMQVMKLERLDEASIAALSESMLGEVGRQQPVVELIQRETEGNVFFMVEVVRALAEEAGQLSDIGAMTLPQQVFAGGMQLVIQRRLGRVPEAARELLRVAAVTGRRLDLRVLRAVDSEVDLAEWLLECEGAAVIEVQDDRWRFAHDKLREGLLAGLSAEQRHELHRRVAEAIEQVYPDTPGQTAALAHHWRMAGNVSKEAHYLALAGEQALNTGAYLEALEFLSSAASIAPQAGFSMERRASIERQTAEAYYATGDFYQSRVHLERTLVLLGKPLPGSKGRLALALLGQAGQQAFNRLRGAGKRPGRLDEEAIMRALTYERIAQIGVLTNAAVLSVYAALRMLNLTEQGGPSAEMARAQVAVGFICGAVPQRRWADSYNRRAWETAQQVGNPAAQVWVLQIRSMYGIGACKWQECYDSLSEARDIAERIGDTRRRDETRGLVNVVLYHMAEFTEAYRRSMLHVQDSAQRVDVYLPLLVQSEILLRLGHEGWAEQIAANLDTAAGRINANTGVEVDIWINGLRALMELRRGQRKAAHDYAERGLAVMVKARPALCYVIEGYATTTETLLHLWETSTDPGEKQELSFQARQACKALKRYARVFLHARSRWLMCEAWADWLDGKTDSALKMWGKSIEEAERLKMPFDAALARYEMARHLPVDDPARQAHLAQAAEAFEAMGAQYDRAQAQAALDT